MFAVRIAILGVALALTSLAGAQTTYRWIDKTTGKTVFSDQPPPPGAKSVSIREGKEPGNERQMNFATRQAAEKYPVTLFTTVNCTEVCANARSFLNGRGVPFTERLLKSEQEIAEAAREIGSDSFVPGLKVGSQRFAGFEAGAWNNLLDLAGYPKSAPYAANTPANASH